VFEQKDGCTRVPLEFAPHGSMFVVFRKRGQKTEVRSQNSTAANFLKFKPVQELAGPWAVQFDPPWFYPTNGLSGDAAKGLVVFDKLEDWSMRPEPSVRHFSGTAVYRKVFDFVPGGRRAAAAAATEPVALQKTSSLWLDLGMVKETARVRLNGKDLGVIWCAPWQVEITGAIKPGENALEIEVINLWPNRLIGDAGLPADQRRTRTNVPTNPAQQRLSSGLLGPVQVMTAE